MFAGFVMLDLSWKLFRSTCKVSNLGNSGVMWWHENPYPLWHQIEQTHATILSTMLIAQFPRADRLHRVSESICSLTSLQELKRSVLEIENCNEMHYCMRVTTVTAFDRCIFHIRIQKTYLWYIYQFRLSCSYRWRLRYS